MSYITYINTFVFSCKLRRDIWNSRADHIFCFILSRMCRKSHNICTSQGNLSQTTNGRLTISWRADGRETSRNQSPWHYGKSARLQKAAIYQWAPTRTTAAVVNDSASKTHQRDARRTHAVCLPQFPLRVSLPCRRRRRVMTQRRISCYWKTARAP